MYGVWQTGVQFLNGQPPRAVSESLSKLESWAEGNIQQKGNFRFFFVESAGAGSHWTDENLTCKGHLYKEGIKMNAGEAKQLEYIATRKKAINHGPDLTQDEQAQRTVNIDATQPD
jgi:hypothetical protein